MNTLRLYGVKVVPFRLYPTPYGQVPPEYQHLRSPPRALEASRQENPSQTTWWPQYQTCPSRIRPDSICRKHLRDVSQLQLQADQVPPAHTRGAGRNMCCESSWRRANRKREIREVVNASVRISSSIYMCEFQVITHSRLVLTVPGPRHLCNKFIPQLCVKLNK